MKKLVLLRHGQSAWNKENRFTGWMDVPLSEQGIEEAKKAGKTLKESGFVFGEAHVSYLQRAIKTLWLALEEMQQMYIPVYKSWRLNEKHYGTLQGLNKSETAAKYGEEQVLLWRRGFAIAPPALEVSDERNAQNLMAYKNEKEIPLTESLEDCIHRFLPYWEDNIKASLKKRDQVLVAAHGNSLRGLVMHLKNLSEEEVLALNIPTGIPYVIELDEQLNYVKDYYLEDEATLQQRMNEVAAQGKSA